MKILFIGRIWSSAYAAAVKQRYREAIESNCHQQTRGSSLAPDGPDHQVLEKQHSLLCSKMSETVNVGEPPTLKTTSSANRLEVRKKMKWIPPQLYLEILTHMPIACVDIAIVSESRILLVERLDAPAKGQFWLPGGRVHKGELLRDAAARKAKEEIGVECHVGPIIHTAETIFPDGPNDIAVHSINMCFFLFPREPKFTVQLDEHHERFIWANTIEDTFHPYVRQCLRAAGLHHSDQ